MVVQRIHYRVSKRGNRFRAGRRKFIVVKRRNYTDISPSVAQEIQRLRKSGNLGDHFEAERLEKMLNEWEVRAG